MLAVRLTAVPLGIVIMSFEDGLLSRPRLQVLFCVFERMSEEKGTRGEGKGGEGRIVQKAFSLQPFSLPAAFT